MGVEHAWIVLSPSISTDYDSVSVISESDQEENSDSMISSKYFWDNTHISLSEENSGEEHMDPDTRLDDIIQELNDTIEETFEERETTSLWTHIKQLSKPSLWISILLVTNLCIFSYYDSEHALLFEKLQFAESQDKDLRLEISTLRKIIFLMNAGEHFPTSPTLYDETVNSEDAKIYADGNDRKFICIDVKRFIDLL